MLFAIDKINNDTTLLPDVKVCPFSSFFFFFFIASIPLFLDLKISIIIKFINFLYLLFFPYDHHHPHHFKVGGHNSRYLFQWFVCFESIFRIHQSFNKHRRKFSISMFRRINSKTKIRRNEDHTRSCWRILFWSLTSSCKSSTSLSHSAGSFSFVITLPLPFLHNFPSSPPHLYSHLKPLLSSFLFPITLPSYDWRSNTRFLLSCISLHRMSHSLTSNLTPSSRWPLTTKIMVSFHFCEFLLQKSNLFHCWIVLRIFHNFFLSYFPFFCFPPHWMLRAVECLPVVCCVQICKGSVILSLVTVREERNIYISTHHLLYFTIAKCKKMTMRET